MQVMMVMMMITGGSIDQLWIKQMNLCHDSY